MSLTFSIIWLVILFIYFFYIAINLFFRLFSYQHDYEKFAGNEEVKQIDNGLHYYVIVPCFNEAAVIQKTLLNLLRFSKFEIVVVDDASTDESVTEISKIHSSRLHLLKRKEPNAHTGKGDVLNFALDCIRKMVIADDYSMEKVIVGVIDADAELAPNALTKLDTHFSCPNSNAVQMRVKMYPHFKNILQVLQDIEFFTINHMSQLMRMYTQTVGLSGNGQFFRLKPIIEKIGVHPWGNALLDDYELTIKMLLKGILVDYITDTYVYQESLSSLRLLIRQRSRWAQGCLDCLKYVTRVIKTRNLSSSQKIGVFYFLAQPWLSMLADLTIIYLTVITIIKLPQLYSRLGWPWLIGVAFGLLITALFIGIIFTILYCHDLKHYREKIPRICQLLFLPINVSYAYLWLFISLIIAFWRWMRHSNSWLKTQHGNS